MIMVWLYDGETAKKRFDLNQENFCFQSWQELRMVSLPFSASNCGHKRW